MTCDERVIRSVAWWRKGSLYQPPTQVVRLLRFRLYVTIVFIFCYISVNAAFSIGAHVLGTGIGQNAYSLRNSRNSRVRRGTLIQSREQPLVVGPSVWNGHSLVARRCNALGGAWSRSVANANYVVCSFFYHVHRAVVQAAPRRICLRCG